MCPDHGNRVSHISAYGYSLPDQTGRAQDLGNEVTGARVIPLNQVLIIAQWPVGVPHEKHSSEPRWVRILFGKMKENDPECFQAIGCSKFRTSVLMLISTTVVGRNGTSTVVKEPRSPPGQPSMRDGEVEDYAGK